jgi:hypothetical protein
MMRDIVVGGLLLPLKVYFQPFTFREEVAALAPVSNDIIVYQEHRLKSVPLRSSEDLPKRHFSVILSLRIETAMRFRGEESDLCGRLGRNSSIARGREPIEASYCPTVGHPPEHGDASYRVRQATGISS